MAVSSVGISPSASSTPIPIAVITDAAGNEYQCMVFVTQNGAADPALVNTLNPLPVSVIGGGVPASSDGASFTAGTTQGLVGLGVYNDGLSPLTSGQMGSPRISPSRQVLVALGASQTDGWTMSGAVAPATPVAVQLKSSAGKIGSIVAGNTDTNWTYLKIFDTASAPTLGTTAANWSIPIPPGSGNNPPLIGGIQFLNGCYWAVTGGPAFADNTAITANKTTVNLGSA